MHKNNSWKTFQALKNISLIQETGSLCDIYIKALSISFIQSVYNSYFGHTNLFQSKARLGLNWNIFFLFCFESIYILFYVSKYNQMSSSDSVSLTDLWIYFIWSFVRLSYNMVYEIYYFKIVFISKGVKHL